MPILLLILCCALAIMGGALPRQHAFAETTDTDGHDGIVVKRDHKLSLDDDNDINYLVDGTTGRILYCISFQAPQPDTDDELDCGGELFAYSDVETTAKVHLPFSGGRDGNKISPRIKQMVRAFDYIAYHGYSGDASIHIGDLTDDSDKLYLATQAALYYVMDTEYVGKMPHHLEDSVIEQDVIDAATALYNQANEYAQSDGTGIEDHTAIWYKDKTDSLCQNILTCAAKGSMHIKKSSSAPGISDASTGYSLEGARFSISRKETPNEVLETLVTDANGEATSKALPWGHYLVKEIEAPYGFAVTPDSVQVTITGGPRFVEVEETPLYAIAGALLTKVDAETGKNSPLGAASLSGARFLVSYYAGTYTKDGLPDAPTRSWTLKTDDQGVIALDAAHLVGDDSDPLYQANDGRVGLPLGTVTVREMQAPKGYALPDGEDNFLIKVIDASMTGQTVTMGQDGSFPEHIERRDVSFDKVDRESGEPMPGVLFRVTSQTTGESHIIITDEKGHFSSRTDTHSNHTNGLDAAVDKDGNVDESTITKGNGVWFYGYQAPDGSYPDKAHDGTGAFPYDTYVFQELPSSATVGHELVSFSVTIPDETTDDASTDQAIHLGKVTDGPITLSTEVRDGNDGDKYLAATGTQTVVDKVAYRGLTPNSSYTLTCTLVNGEDGKVLQDSSGSPYTKSSTFRPAAADGSEEVTVTIDTSGIGATRIVAYERLTQNGSLIATHEDLSDGDQTLYLPRITTVLADASGDQTIPSESSCLLTDTVSYEGLLPGEAYTLEGTLQDKQSRQTLTDGSGKEVKVVATLKPTTSSGTATVTFELDTSGLADHEVVAFETIRKGEKVICSHTDLGDASQTVRVVRNIVSLPLTGSQGLVLTTSLGLLTIGSAAVGRHLQGHL